MTAGGDPAVKRVADTGTAGEDGEHAERAGPPEVFGEEEAGLRAAEGFSFACHDGHFAQQVFVVAIREQLAAGFRLEREKGEADAIGRGAETGDEVAAEAAVSVVENPAARIGGRIGDFVD